MGVRRSLVGPGLLTVAAALLWVRGRDVAALVVLALAVALAHLLVLSPRARAVVARVQHLIATVVSTVVGVILLLPVFVLISLPSLVWDRLQKGRSHPASQWEQRATPVDPRPARIFSSQDRRTHERGAPRTVVRAVACVLLVEAIVIGGVVVVHRRQTAVPKFSGVSSAGSFTAAAWHNLPWAADLQAGMAQATNAITYSPFTGLSIRDVSGPYVNVRNRVRRSYETSLTRTQRPIEIWCFGGSTMFGFDAQRDEHTIPSYLVRAAERDGIAVRVHNFGSTGFANYQETMLLNLELGTGQRPDLVVFYDGINDQSLQIVNDFGHLNPRGEPSELGAAELRQALAARYPQRNAAPPSPLVPTGPYRRVTARGLVQDIVGVYDRGIALTRVLGQRYDFPTSFFWQPDIYSKSPLDPGEKALLPGLGLDHDSLATMRGLSRHIRAALPSGVVDLGAALDQVKGPVLTDEVHTTEPGAQAVAEAMYRTLKPELMVLHARH